MNACILLKNTQISINISIIYFHLAFLIHPTLLNNIKFGDNVVISGDLNTYHTDSNCNKTNKCGIALKKALYSEDIFMMKIDELTNYDSIKSSQQFITISMIFL